MCTVCASARSRSGGYEVSATLHPADGDRELSASLSGWELVDEFLAAKPVGLRLVVDGSCELRPSPEEGVVLCHWLD